MAPATTANQIFEQIEQDNDDDYVVVVAEYDAYLKNKIAQARRDHPTLKDELSYDAFNMYHANKYHQSWVEERKSPLHTAAELFNTAYHWDPMGPTGGKNFARSSGF